MATLIHPTAVIHPGAQLHPTVQVGAYAVIGEKVTVGAGSLVGHHVVLEGRTEIGDRNHIFQNAAQLHAQNISIGVNPEAGRRKRLLYLFRSRFIRTRNHCRRWQTL